MLYEVITMNLMLHAVEMWNNKTPFITGWVETTTLELDCATLIAAPVYGSYNFV